jgi:TolB protein
MRHPKTSVRTFTLAAVLLLLVAFVIVSAAQTAFSAATPSYPIVTPPTRTPIGKIAFASDRDGNMEIYVMAANGTNQTRLTRNTTYDSMPAWSPDGKRIAFISGRDGNVEIYTMNADGTAQSRLTDNSANDVSPDWSPDGKQIVFWSDRDGTEKIYLMNSDGTDQKTLTNTSLSLESSWSPSGLQIAFISYITSNFDIYLINADGTSETRLTTTTSIEREPAWSPDGAKILFMRLEGDNRHISVINADGTGLTDLIPGGSGIGSPSWSPNGTKIVYFRHTGSGYDIFTANADGTGETRLTFQPNFTNWEPDWAPDTVSKVLSPVVGHLEVVNTDTACSGTQWCFNQHQSGGHAEGGGICQADDTMAWDANLNTPAFDSDKDKDVFAVAPGVVAQRFGGCINAGGSFGQVLVQHTTSNGTTWWSGYLHMARIKVSLGQEVTQRTVLGSISNVGVDNGNNHLHFAIYTGSNTLGGLQSFNATITERPTSGVTPR